MFATLPLLVSRGSTAAAAAAAAESASPAGLLASGILLALLLLLLPLLLLVPHLHASRQVDCADEQARLLPAVEVNLPTLARDLDQRATVGTRSFAIQECGFGHGGDSTGKMLQRRHNCKVQSQKDTISTRLQLMPRTGQHSCST
jgi:hypothetical protein